MQLTLSSDPRVWMGGGIPTRWRWYGRDDRDRRDRRLRLQIDTIASVTLSQTCDIFHTFFKKHKQGIGFEVCLRPPCYTLTKEGKVLLRSEPLPQEGGGREGAFPPQK